MKGNNHSNSSITNMRKSKCSFRRMDLGGFEVDRADILKRCMAPSNESSLERFEVLVSNEKLLELKYNRTSSYH